jgi:6-phosphogluconolactonase
MANAFNLLAFIPKAQTTLILFLISFMGVFSIGHTAPGQSEKKEILYVGTFSERDSKGIYVFEFDRERGSLRLLQTVAGPASPSFLAIHPNGKFLYAVYREDISGDDEAGSVVSYLIDGDTGRLAKLNAQSSRGAGPCHISVDPKGKLVYVSNYAGGSIAVLPVLRTGALAPATDVVQHSGSSAHAQRQQKPHMHSVVPNDKGSVVYASDLGVDKIFAYAPNTASGMLKAGAVPFTEVQAGSGPRHFSLHPGGGLAFSAEELTSQLAVYRVDKATGALTFAARYSSLPDDFDGENTTADVHVSPDGRHVYISNRGHNSLAVFSIDKQTGRLTAQGHTGTQGQRPRNFLIEPKGEYVFVANRDTDSVVVMKRDAESGKLAYTGVQAPVPGAVCIKMLSLK